MKLKRSAFSMIELIFVIIVLGIVGSLSAELIANIYDSYILQRAQHRASIKTELIATQIANRLRYAIPDTVIRRVGKTGTPELLASSMNFNPDDYSVLQWVGYDGDGFEAIASSTDRRPGWSGFCDINASTSSTLVSSGSNLDLANTIIAKLSGSTKNIGNAQIYFPEDIASYGINSVSGETITLDTNTSRIVEHYKLSWTSYALVVESGDLYLYYNFDPTLSATIGNTKSLLLKNVTNFKFQGSGRTIRFKICRDEEIGEGSTITSCKEKAVF